MNNVMRTNLKTLRGLSAAGLTGLAAGLAHAHPGHGQPHASHWHATDAWGWALGLAVAAVVLWLMRRK